LIFKYYVLTLINGEILKNKMKQLSKIAIVIALIAFASSCQKDNTTAPRNCDAHQENTGSERRSNLSGADDNSGPTLLQGEETSTDSDDVVGGGDDDRDGGGEKKPKKGGT
jgi:hypothetical protein